MIICLYYKWTWKTERKKESKDYKFKGKRKSLSEFTVKFLFAEQVPGKHWLLNLQISCVLAVHCKHPPRRNCVRDGERATNPHDLGLIPRTHSGRRTDSSKLSSIHPTHLCHVHTYRLLNVNKKKDKLHGKGVKPQGSFTWKWSVGRHWCAEHYSYKYWMALSFPVQLSIMHSCDSLPQNDIHASHLDDWPRNLPATQAAFYIHKNSHCPRWSAHS